VPGTTPAGAEWKYQHAAEAPRANHQRLEACMRDLEFHWNAGNLERALPAAAELVAIRGRAQDWYAQGYCLARSGQELPGAHLFRKATRWTLTSRRAGSPG